MFDEADKNGDGTLDLKEVVQMMKSLNVGVSKKVIKKMFKVSKLCTYMYLSEVTYAITTPNNTIFFFPRRLSTPK